MLAISWNQWKKFLDIPEDKVGVVTEKLSVEKGKMTDLQNHGTGRVNQIFYTLSRSNWL